MILQHLRQPPPDDGKPNKHVSFNDLIASAEAAGSATGYGIGKDEGLKAGREIGATERTAYIIELCREAGNLPCSRLIPELHTLLLGADPLANRQAMKAAEEDREDIE